MVGANHASGNSALMEKMKETSIATSTLFKSNKECHIIKVLFPTP